MQQNEQNYTNAPYYEKMNLQKSYVTVKNSSKVTSDVLTLIHFLAKSIN